MAKHPVPKQKKAKNKVRKRYGSFKTKVLTKLSNRVNLVDCSNCGARIMAHTACPECGMYRGRLVLDMSKKAKKITTIKA